MGCYALRVNYETDDTIWRGIVPDELVHEILTFIHNDRTGGHLGVGKTPVKSEQAFIGQAGRKPLSSCVRAVWCTLHTIYRV